MRVLTLMFQREVAERLTATPRSKPYGRLSVLVQWLAAPEILFDVPPRAFVPPPKVTSSVVRILPRAEPLAPATRPALERVTAAAFGQRRKMLRSSLRTLGAAVEPLLRAAAVPATARAEELTVAEFCALARALDRAGPPSVLPVSPTRGVDHWARAPIRPAPVGRAGIALPAMTRRRFPCCGRARRGRRRRLRG